MMPSTRMCYPALELRAGKMAHIELFLQLVVFVSLVSLPFIEACRYDSECIPLVWRPAQCCNGECVDKYAKFSFWIVKTTIGVVSAFAVVFVTTIIFCLCCSCCPGYRYRPRSTGVISINSKAPYQQFSDVTTATDLAASLPSVGMFYPQPPSVRQFPMWHPV